MKGRQLIIPAYYYTVDLPTDITEEQQLNIAKEKLIKALDKIELKDVEIIEGEQK